MILAIDPGNIESAYAFMDGCDLQPIDCAKIENEELLKDFHRYTCDTVVIEMVASYGMPVGVEVFETVFWIGRFYEKARACGMKVERVFRKDVKLNLCMNPRAKDANVIQALKDRFGDKGTAKNPGWFYGFSKDIWQAYAVGVTYYDQIAAKQNVG